MGVIVWLADSERKEAFRDCGVAFLNIKQLAQKDKLIYLMADKVCGYILDYTKSYVARPVTTLDEFENVFRLIYREYLYRGFIPASPEEMHYGYYYLLPGARTFVLYKEKCLLGTISLTEDSPAGLPMDSIFFKEIAPLRKPGRKLAEVGLLCLNSTMFSKNLYSLLHFPKQAALFRLYKLVLDHARMAGVTDLVIGVRPRSETLYKYFEMDVVSSPRPYAGIAGKPIVLMHLDLERVIPEAPINEGPGKFFLGPIDEVVMQHYYRWPADQLKRFLFDVKPLWDIMPAKVQACFEEQCFKK